MRSRHDGLNVSGLSDAQLQKAARLYEKALRKSDNIKTSENLEIGTSESYNGNINHSLKGKKSTYNEYNTIGMQWAYHSRTQVGDLNILYNKYTRKHVLVKATKEDVGFIELRMGTLKQVEMERKYYESEKQSKNRFDGEQETVDKVLRDSWFGRNYNAWDNVNVRNGGTGIPNVEISKRKSERDKTTDSPASDRNLIEDSYLNESKSSLKRSAIFGDLPATVEDVAPSSNNIASDVPEHTKPSISQSGYLTLELDEQNETASDSLLGWANDKIKERNEAYARAAEASQEIKVSDGAKKK